MIAEQLQVARAAHWRQNQSPLLTLDEAQSWFQQHPLCLYLPRHAQLPAPAPSFVEACGGSRQATPGAEAIEQARALLVRLVAAGTVVPLNLLGSVSEQPDFLAHTDALPFVISLRADADWKHAPQKSSGHKVSPLVLELWKALEKDGALTAAEAREALGRELTEAAVLRGLCELWQTLRISPVFPGEGQPARWEMLRVHHRAALTTAGNTGQVTAISLLVSMYLQSVYAASSDEIEIFLSPVASRSRVREAVRGLAATRQIHSLSMEAQTYYFLEGGLPEFAELPAAAPAEGLLTAPSEARRPLPVPRKVQATRPVAAAASPSVPASVPIFRRPAPPAVRRDPAPSRPAARTGGKPPGRPAWTPAAKPYARRADTMRKEGGAPPSSRPQRPFSPAAARPGQASPRDRQRGADAFAKSRIPQESQRPNARPDGPPRRDSRPGTRYNSRPAARSGAPRPRPADGRPPGRWTGAAKRDTPKPWALPGRKPSGPPRPAGRSDAPFRPRGAGRPPTAPFPDRTNRPPRPPFSSASGPAAGQPSGRPSRGYRQDERPRTAGPRAKQGSERGSGQGWKPDARRVQGRPAPPPPTGRPGEPRSPRPDGPGRPFKPRSGPPKAGRSAPPRGAGQGAASGRPRPSGRPPFPASPRPGRGPRPPFVSGPRSGKPAKPPANFRDRKPDRKKPGA